MRTEWFDSYITTILQRDVRLLSEIEKIALLPCLLRTLAARAGKLVNDAEIARDIVPFGDQCFAVPMSSLWA